MRRGILTGLVVLLTASGLFGAEGAYRPGYILARFADVNGQPPSTTFKDSFLKSLFGTSCSPVAKEYGIVRGLTLVQLPAGVSVENAKIALGRSPSILYAEPDYGMEFRAVPNDTRFGQQWALNNTGQTGGVPDADIDAPEAWNISTGSNNIIVAVTDTGVDYNHPDLAANMWVNVDEIPGNGVDDDGNGYIDDIYGANPAGASPLIPGDWNGDPMDPAGHGTHVAGTIGAVGNNGIGVAGVCWRVKIMAVRIGAEAVYDWDIFISDAVAGIEYAVDNGARVINASWGFAGYSQPIYDAIAGARDAGVLFVAAAGNSNEDNDVVPDVPTSFDLDNIISVLATDDTDEMAYFSNYGATTVDLGAPGLDIVSTLAGNRYGQMSGTSMASPHVAGAAALVLSVAPTLSYTNVKSIILSTVDPLESLDGLCVTGGRLNLYKAVQEAAVDTMPPAPDPPVWDIAPKATGLATIAMEAAKVTDRSGVEYYFECVSDATKSSTWQSGTSYQAAGLSQGTTYGFRVKARDKSPRRNETGWSTTVYATTASGADNLSPAPDPARWLIKPKLDSLSPLTIRMRAKPALDGCMPVQYYFDCTNVDPPGVDPDTFDSGWIGGDTYIFTHPQLLQGSTYTFVLRTRDDCGNETMPSEPAAVLLATSTSPRERRVPSQYYTIQAACDAANNGDIVVLAPGTYRWNTDIILYADGNYLGPGNNDIIFSGTALGGPAKKIIVRSTEPNNPAIVAATVIDGLDLQGNSHRGFKFIKGEGRDSVLEGVTLRNCVAREPNGNDGGDGGPVPDGSPGNPGIAGGPGYDGAGGAIMCGTPAGVITPGTPSSPSLLNLVIENCVAAGGNGGNGGNGGDGGNVNEANSVGPGGAGGNGGRGGFGYGGAIFCSTGSHPLIDNCRIADSLAEAGSAGTGGNGGNGGTGRTGTNPWPGGNGGKGGNGGDAGGAFGGAIYAAAGSSPLIVGCTIESSTTSQAGTAAGGGTGGLGGTGSISGSNGAPGTDGKDADAQAGGIYAGLNSIGIDIIDCNISANTSTNGANGGGVYLGPLTASLVARFQGCRIAGNSAGSTVLGSGGGVWYGKDTGTIIFEDCNIVNNIAGWGGGVSAGQVGSNRAVHVEIRDSNVSGNGARYGGGLLLNEVDLMADGLVVSDNNAIEGAGLSATGSRVAIRNSTISQNGGMFGGGCFLLSSGIPSTIEGSVFTDNSADGFGGAVMMEGGNLLIAPVEITNCLFVGNDALYDGGALSCAIGAKAEVNNCTFIGNEVLDTFGGSGGAVSCREFYAQVKIENSILWDNTAAYGNEIAVGTPYGSDPYGLFADVDVNYCDIKGLDDGIFVEDWDYTAVWWWYGNIDADPCFASTDINQDTYYLSQLAAGQLVDSPCFDTGSGDASWLSTRLGKDVTTRTDHFADSALTDMGYHYDADTPVRMYELRTEVADGIGRLRAEGGGSDPFVIWDPDARFVNAGTVVALTAVPDAEYKLMKWQGTDNDASTALTNTVTMNADKNVSVTFEPNGFYFLTVTVTGAGTVSADGQVLPNPARLREQPGVVVNLTALPANPSHIVIWNGTDDDYTGATNNTVTMTGNRDVNIRFYSPRILYVGADSDYRTIQLAINDAHDRDIVMVTPGTYNIRESSEDNPYLLISGKDITLTSTVPNDPTATTVIGGFVIQNVTRHTVIQGFTIRDAMYFKDYEIGTVDDVDPNTEVHWATPQGTGIDGYGGGTCRGGGMELYDDASPTVRDCSFVNCVARGIHGATGAGGTGLDGYSGNGGPGGKAYGGGAYCGVNGSPLFENCSFVNCSAQGGDGGNGGDSPPAVGGHGGAWGDNEAPWWNEWNQLYGGIHGPLEEYWKYSGYGGAIFCDRGSTAEFVNCTFTGNLVRGGSCGISGDVIPSGWPSQHYKIDSFGGAVYATNGSSPRFVGCVFTANEADMSGPATSRKDNVATVNAYVNISYGGAVAFEDGATPLFEECTFSNNAATVGGAAYGAWAYPSIENCDFTDNTSYHAAGIALVGGTSKIVASRFIGNSSSLTGAQGGAIAVMGADAEIVDCNITDNQTTGYGGGIYASSKDIEGHELAGGNEVLVKNCLIVGNNATEGGGISANWHAEPNIFNCTFAGNMASTAGGGLRSAYGNYAQVINSILWGNTAPRGAQISVGTQFNPSWVSVIYSDVQGGRPGADVETGSTLEWDVDMANPAYPTNIRLDPRFVNAAGRDFHLSQLVAGQAMNSPCVDKGSGTVSALGLSQYTTRTDEQLDRMTVDMGYHYLVAEECRFCDIVRDGAINFRDLAAFAQQWLNTACSGANAWCGGADVTFDGVVQYPDLEVITDCWLAMDKIAPSPDPAQWQVEPYSTSQTSITMLAAAAVDTLWGLDVNYFFDCVLGNCHGSGWIAGPNYVDANLEPNAEYGYRVKVRDMAGNETEWSVERYAVAGAGGGVPGDTTPPSPDPMTWAVVPYATNATTITMMAMTATDVSGPVQYQFEETTGGNGGTDSGWIGTQQYTDAGLDANTQYCYRVRARDAANNMTGWSSTLCATPTDVNDNTPPTPAPTILYNETQRNVQPDVNTLSGQYQVYATARWWHKIVADVTGITDASPPITIRFICQDSGFNSPEVNIDGSTPEAQRVDPGGKWRVTYDGSSVVYDVDMNKIGGVGVQKTWTVCVYDVPRNQACSAPYSVGPVPP